MYPDHEVYVFVGLPYALSVSVYSTILGPSDALLVCHASNKWRCERCAIICTLYVQHPVFALGLYFTFLFRGLSLHTQ